MNWMMQDPIGQLRRLIVEGRISEDSLQAITGIQSERLGSLLNQTRSAVGVMTSEPQAVTAGESVALSVLAAHLTDGLAIGDDERLTAIFESLMGECRLSLSNIALLIHVDIAELESTLRDPQTVPMNAKYELTIRGSYLISAMNLARAFQALETQIPDARGRLRHTLR